MFLTQTFHLEKTNTGRGEGPQHTGDTSGAVLAHYTSSAEGSFLSDSHIGGHCCFVQCKKTEVAWRRVSSLQRYCAFSVKKRDGVTDSTLLRVVMIEDCKGGSCAGAGL